MSGVVIGVGAAVGAVVGGGSGLYGISKANRNQIKAFKQQMKYLQLNYNYNQAALDRQEKSMYDSAMVELFGLSMNAYQNNAQIEAAIAETGLEGRSQEKIQQVIYGQTSRQETATKEAYKQGVWEVRGQKEALYITTKNEVEQARSSLQSNLVGGTRAFMQVMSSAVQGAAIGAATAGVGSAVGGALGGAASSAAASTATGASAGIGGAGAVSTSLGSGFLSSYGIAANSAVAGGAATTAASTGLSSGALAGIGGAGVVASTGMSGASSSASIASNTGSSFLGNVVTNYQQYKPYVDFVQRWANYYNSNITHRERGGYFY
nr:MAG TPA: putative internal virion protein B [Caudoviricetes sp.]